MIIGAPQTWNWEGFLDSGTVTGQCWMRASDGKTYVFSGGHVKTLTGSIIYTFPVGGGTSAPDTYNFQPCAYGDWFYVAKVSKYVKLVIIILPFLDYYIYFDVYAYNPVTGTAVTLKSYSQGASGVISGGATAIGRTAVAVDPSSGRGLVSMTGYIEPNPGTIYSQRTIGIFVAGTPSASPSGFSTSGLLFSGSGPYGGNVWCSAYSGWGMAMNSDGTDYKHYKIADLTSPSLSTIHTGSNEQIPMTGPNLYVLNASSTTIRQEGSSTRAWSVATWLGSVSHLGYLGQDATYWYVLAFPVTSEAPALLALEKASNTVALVEDWGSARFILPPVSGYSTGSTCDSGSPLPIPPSQYALWDDNTFRQLRLPITEVF